MYMLVGHNLCGVSVAFSGKENPEFQKNHIPMLRVGV